MILAYFHHNPTARNNSFVDPSSDPTGSIPPSNEPSTLPTIILSTTDALPPPDEPYHNTTAHQDSNVEPSSDPTGSHLLSDEPSTLPTASPSTTPPRQSSRTRTQLQRLIYPPEKRYSVAAKTIHHQLQNEKMPTSHLRPPHLRKLVHSPMKPNTPSHIHAALKDHLQSHWIDCLFNAYDKMHGTGTLSLPFPISLLPRDTTVLCPRLTCEVRITDTDNYYELKCRLCVDGSRMVVGIYFDLSYAPVIDEDSLLLMIALAWVVDDITLKGVRNVKKVKLHPP